MTGLKFLKLPYLVFVYMLFVSNPACSTEFKIMSQDNLENFFDAAYKVQSAENKLSGMTVAIVRDTEVLLTKGYGFSDVENQIPVDPQKHLFRLGSISKTFTWTAIMQLVEQGHLDLNADIGTYLDFDIPNTYEVPIRLKHLLTHTAGFEDQSIKTSAKNREHLIPLQRYVADFLPARVREPGTFVSYSNYGSTLAGYIVERVSGMSWADYIQLKILGPLEMTDTNVIQPLPEFHSPSHAKSYRYLHGQFVPSDYILLNEGPSGSMSSTAKDMASWMQTHLNMGSYGDVQILRPETARLMQTELFRQHPKDLPVLHGFYRSDRNGIEVIGHGGDVNQFHSEMILVPNHNVGFYISYNSDTGYHARNIIIPAFLDYFFQKKSKKTTQLSMNFNLEDYVGTWNSTRRNHSTFEKLGLVLSQMRVSRSGQELVLRYGLDTSRWVQVEKDYFRQKYTDRHLIFYRDNQGEVTNFSILGKLESYERLVWYETGESLLISLLLVCVLTITYLTRFLYLVVIKRDVVNDFSWIDRPLAAISSLIILYLVFLLVAELISGDPLKFTYGVPDSFHIASNLSFIVFLLSLGMTACVIRQWAYGMGNLMARLNYGLITIVAILFVLSAWIWNILGFRFYH